MKNLPFTVIMRVEQSSVRMHSDKRDAYKNQEKRRFTTLNHNPLKIKRNSRKEHERKSSGKSKRLSGKGRHPFHRRLQAMA